jgi:nitrilase
MRHQKVTVGAAHVAPVYLNAQATVEKACRLIAEAASGGADLIAFPESFVPGFPVWPSVSPPIRNHSLFELFVSQSIRVPGPEVFQICQAARAAQIIVSIGISESTSVSVGCIWNTNLLIGRDGSILNHHRKLVPTFFEKLIWANGDGSGLRVVETDAGRIGMLICGENTNPLARYAMIAEGEQIHISSYPPVWPTHDPHANNAYDLASAIRIRAGAHSFEAKVFNVVSSSLLNEATLDALTSIGQEGVDVVRNSPRAPSMIINPHGAIIAETSSKEDELLIAEIDLQDCVVPKQFHDLSGYYNRFDIFNFKVDRTRRPPAEYSGADTSYSYPYETIKKLEMRSDIAE